MRMALLVLALAVSGCGATTSSTDNGGGGAGGSSSGTGGATTTATAGAGGTAAGGAGSAGGHTGGAGGSTGTCEPLATPCGDAVCGTVDDGCGTPVECGTCGVGQPCVDGACCVPKTCADYPDACDGAQRPNGCGGTLFCGDATCGDGVWMTCSAGTCACAPATDYPNAAQSQGVCNQTAPGTKASYCGPMDPAVPAGCVWTASANGAVPGNPGVWCCP